MSLASDIKAHSEDLYCYACDDAKIDPDLATHLGNLGLDVGGQKKTEKTMTELVRLFLTLGTSTS